MAKTAEIWRRFIQIRTRIQTQIKIAYTHESTIEATSLIQIRFQNEINTNRQNKQIKRSKHHFTFYTYRQHFVRKFKMKEQNM